MVAVVAAAAAQRPQGGSTIGMNRSIRYPGAFSAMSSSPYGRDVVLAGRAGLAVVDLDHPLSPARTVPIESTWKISRVAWCPSVEHHGWVATAVNQTLLVHDLGSTGRLPMRALRAHPMGITDIAWAPLVPSWVGTASIDPVVKIWDVRRDQKPVWYFSKWEPADMLAFSPVHMHKLASVHRNRIAIWDIRFGSAPLVTLDDAHADDITGISWHPTQDDALVSASQDHTVKRWWVKYNQPTEEYTHLFAHEVAGVEYLPFGEALLVTQRSADHQAAVIRDAAELTVVHQFAGLTSTVLGTAWRSRCEASRMRYQLITWEKDQILRMWAVGDSTVAAAGGTALQCEVPAAVPSFATNFLQPEQLLGLLDQKTADGDLLLAATTAEGDATTWHELARTGRLARGRAATPVWKPGQPPAARAAVARASTTDEHTTDDDDEDDDDASRHSTGPTAWQEELERVVFDRYQQSGTVMLPDSSTVGRFRRLRVGVPWITSAAVELGVSFPVRYPRAALRIAVDAAPAVFGPASALADRAAAMADACAEQGVPALDRCLYTVLTALIEAARSQRAHAEGDRAEDLERIPPPPPPLQPAARRPGPESMAARLFGRPPTDDTLSSDESRSGSDISSRAGRPRHGRGTGSLYSDEINDDNDDEGNEDDDDEFYALGYDDGAGLYGSDSSHAEAAAAAGGADDVARRATRDRNLSRVPFPRLCGAVFAGPGQLVCFFASIYPADKYPEMSGTGQPQEAGRDRSREDMLRQLHQQAKPRMFRKLAYYQGIVQFGSQTSSGYLAYGASAGPLVNSGSLGDSDDERNELQDEEVPRYYFRQQPTHRAAGPAAATAAGKRAENGTYFRPSYLARADVGIGNIAMVCLGVGSEAANRRLARQFVLTGRSAEWICHQNAKVAACNGLPHLAHVWSLLACVLGPVSGLVAAAPSATTADILEPGMWLAYEPVNRWLQTEMARYERRGDIQTLALIACVITKAVAEAAKRRGRAADADAADMPPWMAAAAVSATAVAVAAAVAPGATHSAPNRNVSFRLPSSSGASLLPSGQLQSLQLGPTQHRLPAGADAAGAAEDLLRSDADGHGMQPSAGGLTAAATPMASGAATHVPPSEYEPDSPELLKELDSDEIKQNELMMAEGMDNAKALTRLPSPMPAPPVARPFADDADTDTQRRSLLDKAEERSPAGADSGENLWRRLRTNVFSRVNTTSAVAAKSPSDDSVAHASSEPAADLLGPNGRRSRSNSSAGRGGALGTDGRGRGGSRVPFEESQIWAALQRPHADRQRGAGSQEEGHEQTYMRVKKDYARAHTRMVMHEEPPTFEMWAQAPHHNTWKLLYARILFRWEMDVKAVEVLKCVQDARYHDMYYDLYCQPSVPRHDNLPRIGNPVLAIKQSARKRPPNATANGPGEAKTRRRQADHPAPPPEPLRVSDGAGSAPPSDECDAVDMESGAPWLSCAWCHEYVHGRALICHACGHGGHQEHMLRWFRIVRKNLMRIGLTPAQYVQCSSVSSHSSTTSLYRGASGHADGEPATALASAVPSVVTAGDLVRSFANSPMLGAESLMVSSSERLPQLLPDPLLSDDADTMRHGLHIRMHGPSSLSRQLSHDSHRIDTCDSSDSDSDSDHMPPRPAAGLMAVPDTEHQPFLPDSYAWESSDMDSDDQIQPSHGIMLRRELRAIGDFDQEPLDAELDEAARIMQQGIPTCPTGCGCNCLYESYRLII
ncbi:hypothetical protein H4R19_001968 [Coemansia spiralis]|nr:hypothetical protein H4R19_001968 [Coemansia spiralis]